MNLKTKFGFASVCLGLFSIPCLIAHAQSLESNGASDQGSSLFQSPDITKSPPLPNGCDAGSASEPHSIDVNLMPIKPTQRVVIYQDSAASLRHTETALKVSETQSAAPQPSTVAERTRDTTAASLINATTLPPNRSVIREADKIPQRSEQKVQIAQTEPMQMRKPKITPSDPPNMLKDKLGYDGWGQVLSSYTQLDTDGLVRFDYAALAASPEDIKALDAYLEDMVSKSPSTFTREQAMVYWANLYNALTVKVVAENFPVKSIRKIKSGFRPGPWRRKLISVEGEELTLDNIEHDIMRPTFNTPLVHYMVNCASIGCPNLKQTPWQTATLDEDLEAAARAYINSPRGVIIDKGRLKVSSIYNWFDDDFGGNELEVIAHLKQYADDDLSPKLIGRKKIDKYGYDWGINAP